MLADVTNVVILPSHRATNAAAEQLRVRAEALSSAPSESSLKAARDAWRSARKAWHQADAFRFGPVETKNISKSANFWPARPESIEAFIASAEPVTHEAVKLLGSNTRGFGALEVLLFDSAAGDSAVLARLTTDPSAARRCAYLRVIAELLKASTEELLQSWEPASGNFAKEVADAGGTSVLFPSGKSAIDQLVNSLASAQDLVTGTKLGKPYGTTSGGNPLPDQEESPRSDSSLQDMLDTLEGIRNVYLGDYGGVSGRGIDELVRARNPALDARVVAAIDDARAKIAQIPPPFRTAILTQRGAVDAAYQANRTAKRTLSVEVANTLGTALFFNDNDGD